MIKRLVAVAVLLLAVIAISGVPSRAADKHILQAGSEFTPDATMSHPKSYQLAAVAPEGMDIALCHFEYGHGRSKDPDSAYPHLSSGGKVKVTLQLVSEEGTRKIARGRAKVTVEDNGLFDNRSTYLGWADSAGDFWGWGIWEYTRNKNFPVHLEPGDMLLWTVTFKGMPPLEWARDAEPWYADGFTVGAYCRSCGSPDTPCPDGVIW